MSDKTKNQTSDLPNAHGGRLEENPGTGLINVKEEVETYDMNSHQTEIRWSLPADADILKVVITEDLFAWRQVEAPDEETSDSISPDEDNADIVKVEITEDLYTCDQVKTEENKVTVNTATGYSSVKPSFFTTIEQIDEPYVNSFPFAKGEVDSEIVIILVMARVQMFLLIVYKMKAIMWKMYVLPRKQVSLHNRQFIQTTKDFHVLTVGNLLLRNHI
ncbi:uncharacterized protein LOC128657005 isoform X3 [Bombina bombina]|uniref:uncharacterized protein LOC128657005 isoform X3 n=1 Tax=Bombina bombina TaxID=8345 RepID=UPI00235AE974|nr:uncharacterized protein LOC128657005 isoform X3 [Bombina bombina]